MSAGLTVLVMLIAPALTSAEDFGVVRGTVESTFGRPVTFANVVLADHLGAMSDSAGIFLVRGVPPGDYALKISRFGYAPFQQAVEIQAGETTSVRVVLEPVPAASYPREFRRGAPLGEVLPLLTASQQVQAYRLATGEFAGETVVTGPFLSRNQRHTLEWLLLEKDGKLVGFDRKWVVELRPCDWFPVLEFRFPVEDAEGIISVDVRCM